MKNIMLNDLPKLASWFENGTIEQYIDDLKSDIANILSVEEAYEQGSEERENIHNCCLRLAYLIADMSAIRREVKTAELIIDAGLKPKKGGVDQ